MGAFILTIVILFGNNAAATITVEYSSKDACEAAKSANRLALQGGSVMLSTCTKK